MSSMRPKIVSLAKCGSKNKQTLAIDEFGVIYNCNAGGVDYLNGTISLERLKVVFVDCSSSRIVQIISGGGISSDMMLCENGFLYTFISDRAKVVITKLKTSVDAYDYQSEVDLLNEDLLNDGE